MNIFSEFSKCCKCGSGRICTAHKESNHPLLSDYMERTCENCGYKWSEMPLDRMGEVK